MAEDPQTGAGEKKLRLGDRSIQISEPVPIETVAADVLIDLRMVNGTTVAVGFATLLRDGTGDPEARVCARLRLSIETLADMQRGITNLLNEASSKAKIATN